jgi:hypothetical protein
MIGDIVGYAIVTITSRHTGAVRWGSQGQMDADLPAWSPPFHGHGLCGCMLQLAPDVVRNPEQ